MPKPKIIVPMLAIFAFLTGCTNVASLHPLADEDGRDTVFDPALLGAWEDPTDTSSTRLTFTLARADSGSGYSYNVTSGSEESNGTMYLIKTAGRYLMDIYCKNNDGSISAHVFVRLRLEKDTAWVATMDSDWLREQIETRGELRHEIMTESDNRLVLTASRDELRRYLLPYAADERSFSEEGEVRRVAPKDK